MALKPLTYEDPLYQLLRDGNVKEFNPRKAQDEKCDLTACDFRRLDLRGLDADGTTLPTAVSAPPICAASTAPGGREP